MKTFSQLTHFSIIAAILIAASAKGTQAQHICSDGGILVDSPDPGYTENGSWKDICTWDLVGQSNTSVRQTEQDGAWAKWTAMLPMAGQYRVFYWHVPCSDSAAKFEITHGGHTDTVTRNVSWGHLGWTSLGDYDFAADDNASVKVTRGIGKLIVDSIKFLPVTDIKPIPPLPAYPKPDGSLPHFDSNGNLIISGRPYPVIYQELHEETTAHPELIATNFDETFDMAEAQGVNTLGTMIYWRTFEKTPGNYDFTILDALIEKAKARNMHLSLILFFAWRNLQSYYLPPYIAKDHNTYLFDHLADGTEDPHRKVSPFADATRAAETKALTALFQRVLEKDPDHQVVIMAQLENEMPAPRDYSAPALAAWNAPVPEQLIKSLLANEGSIDRNVWKAWDKHGHRTAGTWAEVFGDDNIGGRIFGAWCAGCYIRSLATDLKKVIDLPFYMNAWVGESASTYTYMDVFHAAAPILEAMGPDAYGTFKTWETDVGLSQRSWNRLLIPEQEHTAEALWRAVGNYNAIISGQWHTVEGFDWLDCRETYDLFTQMSPLIMSKRGGGDMIGFFQSTHQAGDSWSEYFNDLRITYSATVRNHLLVGKPKTPTTDESVSNIHLGELDGCGLLIALGGGEYVLTSTRIDIALSYINGGPITVSEAEAGRFTEGEWKSESAIAVEQHNDSIVFHFPEENRHYEQIKFKLSSQAANPAKIFEAERGQLIGAAERVFNSDASGAFSVGGLRGPVAGVEIATDASFEAANLTIRYASRGRTRATVLINGKSCGDFDIPPTGRTAPWANYSLPLRIPIGSTLTIAPALKSSAPDIDCIVLSRDAIAPSTTRAVTPPASGPATRP